MSKDDPSPDFADPSSGNQLLVFIKAESNGDRGSVNRVLGAALDQIPSRSVSPRPSRVGKDRKRSNSFTFDVQSESGQHKKIKIVVEDDKSQEREEKPENKSEIKQDIKQEKNMEMAIPHPFYLNRGGPSMWDRGDVIPKLTFVNENDPSAGSDEYTIGIPAVMDDAFLMRMDELSMGKRYKHLHINFQMESSVEYRHLLMQKLGEICAETVTSVDTYMTKDDFPFIVRNKIGFVIQKENHSFFSTGYLRVIKSMFTRSIDLMYLETPISRRKVVYWLEDELKRDYDLGRLCKSDAHRGIIIDQPLFNLTLKMAEGLLKVESHL